MLLAAGDVVAAAGQYGAVGLIALFLGWFSWRAWQREVTRNDRNEARNQHLIDEVLKETRDALTANAATVGKHTEVLAEAVALIEQVADEVIPTGPRRPRRRV